MKAMKRLVLESWLLLLYFDCLMQFRGFRRVHEAVRGAAVERRKVKHMEAEYLSRAVDLACVIYFKQVLCLQRSAVLAVLMRRRGLGAEMVIGVQLLPFQSHAWVEADGHVVNDKAHVVQVFQILERC